MAVSGLSVLWIVNIFRDLPDSVPLLILAALAAFTCSLLGFSFLYSYWWFKTDKQACPKCHACIVQCKTQSEVNGVAAEIDYFCQNCGTVGYWAYGNYDPNLPYPSEEEKIKESDRPNRSEQ